MDPPKFAGGTLQHVALAVEEADTGRAVHLMRAPCREVNVQSVEVDLQVRYGLACVEHNHRAYLVRTFHHRRDVGDAPVVLPHGEATIFVRSVITSSAVLARIRPSSSRSNHFSVAPVRAASSWNGSNTE